MKKPTFICNLLIALFWLGALSCDAFIFGTGGSSTTSAYHADNIDNGGGTNVNLTGVMNFPDGRPLIVVAPNGRIGLMTYDGIGLSDSSLNYWLSPIINDYFANGSHTATDGNGYTVPPLNPSLIQNVSWNSISRTDTSGEAPFPAVADNNQGDETTGFSLSVSGAPTRFSYWTPTSFWAYGMNAGNGSTGLGAGDYVGMFCNNSGAANCQPILRLKGNNALFSIQDSTGVNYFSITTNGAVGSAAGLTNFPASVTQFSNNVVTSVTGGGATLTTNASGIAVTLAPAATNILFWAPSTYLKATNKTAVFSTNYFVTLSAGVWRYMAQCVITNASATPGGQGGLYVTNASAMGGRGMYNYKTATGTGPGESVASYFQPNGGNPMFAFGGLSPYGGNAELMRNSSASCFVGIEANGVFTLTNSLNVFWTVSQSWQGTADAANAAVLWTNSYALFMRIQ